MRPLSRDLLFRDPDTRTRWWCDKCCRECDGPWHLCGILEVPFELDDAAAAALAEYWRDLPAESQP